MRITSFLPLIGISIFFIFIGMGQIMYEEKPDIDIYELSDNMTSLIRSSMNFNITNLTEVPLDERNVYRFSNLISYFCDYTVNVLTEVMGFGMEYGFNHPGWNAHKIALLILWLVIGILFVNLIIPLIVVGYFIYLLCNIIKNYMEKRIKERKKNN